MKINTRLGEVEVDFSDINSFYCHVNAWRKSYCIILVFNSTAHSHINRNNNFNNQPAQDQITALCSDFDDMMRTCKKIHDEIQYSI